MSFHFVIAAKDKPGTGEEVTENYNGSARKRTQRIYGSAKERV